MSIVTSVIVTCPLGNERAIAFVNRWLDAGKNWALAEAPGGGNKAVQATVLVGAFSHYGFSTRDLLEQIRCAPREDLEHVRVFVKEEDDDAFTERLHRRHVPGAGTDEDVDGLMNHERLAMFRANKDLAPDVKEVLGHADVVARTAGALGAALDDCIQDLADAGGDRADVDKWLAVLRNADGVLLEAYPED